MYKKRQSLKIKFFYIALLIFSLNTTLAKSETHGIAIFDNLKYGPDFKHFDYVNPNALKGGILKLSAPGSFDSFNPFIIKGTPAAGSQLLHCTLTHPSADESASAYGYLAEKIEISHDRLTVIFTLNASAQFSDGSPVTAEDVVFSFHTLMAKGNPLFGLYYKDVSHVEILDKRKVKFILKHNNNRELPLILGQLPILSKSYYSNASFSQANLTPPVGCGPYRVESFDAGNYVKYVLKPHWWGHKIPSQVGINNFDILYQYYRDQQVSLEAFKAGLYDFRHETVAKNWMHNYEFPAITKKQVLRKETQNRLPAAMQLFVFNTRNPLFQDLNVRKALTLAFDFEWVNKNLFFNAYTRAQSYFNNSPLASSGLPREEELKILSEFKNQLPVEIFTTPYTLPKTNGSGNNRENLKIADQLLKDSGLIIKNGVRVHKATTQPFTFTFLVSDPIYERVILAYKRDLKRLGIEMNVQTVHSAQYMEHLSNHTYDVIFIAIAQSENPGNEQRNLWGSQKADQQGSDNYAGIKNPVIDQLIERLIRSSNRTILETNTHALDRVLLWGYYGVPGWYSQTSRFAYWDKFGQPTLKPKDGIGLMTWWIIPQKEQQLNLKKK